MYEIAKTNKAEETNLSMEQGQKLANEGKLSFSQLLSLMPSTDGKTTPSVDWVKEHLDDDQVFYRKDFSFDGSKLIVFKNGFFAYIRAHRMVILRVDHCSKIYFETDENGGYKVLEENKYMEEKFLFVLLQRGEWQYKNNEKKRDAHNKRKTVPLDSIVMENCPDDSMSDPGTYLGEREEKNMLSVEICRCLKNLTSKQREVFDLHYFEKMSYPQISVKLGISVDSAKDRYKGACENLKKNLKNFRKCTPR